MLRCAALALHCIFAAHQRGVTWLMTDANYKQAMARARALREGKGLSTRNVAARLDVDNATISRYERGLIRPSTEMLERYARELGTTLEELFQGTTSTGRANVGGSILRLIRDEVIEARIPDPPKVRVPRPKAVGSRSDLERAVRYLLQLGAGHDGTVNVAWTSRMPLPTDGGDRSEFGAAFDRAVIAGAALDVVVTVSGSAEQRSDLVHFLLQRALRALMHSDLRIGLRVREVEAFEAMPTDALLCKRSGNAIAVLGLPANETAKVDVGLLVDGGDAVQKYIDLVRSEGMERIKVFAPDQTVAWVRHVIDIHGGDQHLSQAFFGWDTRPIECFAPGTIWYRRSKKCWGHEVDKIAEIKRESYRSFRKNLGAGFQFRQVACAHTIQAWCQTGARDDVKSSSLPSGLNDSPDDRRKRIDAVLDLLLNERTFELALVDDFTSRPGGAADGTVMSWVVDGKSRLIVETHVPQQRCRPSWKKFVDSGFDQVGVLLDDQSIADSAREMFDQRWGKIPNRAKERRHVMERLKTLRNMIPE
jgi:transcriptional regulator with XRE-family HTH domain